MAKLQCIATAMLGQSAPFALECPSASPWQTLAIPAPPSIVTMPARPKYSSRRWKASRKRLEIKNAEMVQGRHKYPAYSKLNNPKTELSVWIFNIPVLPSARSFDSLFRTDSAHLTERCDALQNAKSRFRTDPSYLTSLVVPIPRFHNHFDRSAQNIEPTGK